MFGTPQFKTELMQAVQRRAAIAKMADEMLANTVIEDYEVVVSKAAGA